MPISIKEAVAPFSTSYHGELYALKLATSYLKITHTPDTFKEAHILSDCQSALTSCSSHDTHKSHQSCIDEIQTNVKHLRNKGVVVNMHWVAGHVNLTGNELADTAAKSAAKDAEEGELPYITSASTICGIINIAQGLRALLFMYTRNQENTRSYIP